MLVVACPGRISNNFSPARRLIEWGRPGINWLQFLFSVIALTLLIIPVYSQLPIISATWGRQDTLFKTSRVDVVGRTAEGGIYVLKERMIKGIESPYVLEFFNTSLQRTLSLDLKRSNTQHVVQIKNKLYLISSQLDKKQKKISLIARVIDTKLLKPDDKEIKLYDVAVSKNSAMHKTRFTFWFSPDSSKIFALGNLSQSGDRENIISIALLNENLRALWHKKVVLPYPAGQFRLESLRVNRAGNVYVLSVSQNNHDLITIRNEGDSITRYPIRMKGCYINSAQIEIEGEDNLFCVGLYSENSPNSVRGIYYINLNVANQQVLSQCNSEFDMAFILQDLNKQEMKWIDEKSSSNESAELYHYILDKVWVGRDGSIFLAAEQRYRYHYNTNNDYPLRNNLVYSSRVPRNLPYYMNNWYPNPYTITYPSSGLSKNYHFVANNILVTKLDPSGQIRWSRKIHKSQNTIDDNGVFSSYLRAALPGKTCFFFDEDPRNVNYERADRPKDFSGSKSIVAVVSLDEEGTLTKQWIYNSAEIDVTIVPKMSKLISGNELILFGRKQYYQQLGRVTIR